MADIDPMIAGKPNNDRRTAPLAVVTGASSGIGLELARIAAGRGYDLIVAADEFPAGFELTHDDAAGPGELSVVRIESDLSTASGVDELVEAIGDRPVAVLCANAGEGLGDQFLDQDFARIRHMIDTNITGTIDLIQRIAPRMREAGFGRILLTGSIAGLTPTPYQAAYGGTKAFINSFGEALREELSGSGVSVTVLMPGATETRFFKRAGMLDTKVGTGPKDEARGVAEQGWKALMEGDNHVVSGAANKLRATLAILMPERLKAKQQAADNAPGSAEGKSMIPALLVGGAIAASALALLLRSGGNYAGAAPRTDPGPSRRRRMQGVR